MYSIYYVYERNGLKLAEMKNCKDLETLLYHISTLADEGILLKYKVRDNCGQEIFRYEFRSEVE